MNLDHRVLAASTVVSHEPPKCSAERPCATCPFVLGNDKALARFAVDMNHPGVRAGRIGQMLRPLTWVLARLFPTLVAKWTRRLARLIANDLPFICHSSLYKFDGAKTTVRAESEWRLCAGVRSIDSTPLDVLDAAVDATPDTRP